MYDPDTNTFELEHGKPLVLLLGNVDHEGVLSMLQASDRQYKQKLLRSSPENWQNIVDYFDDFEITGVLIKLDPHAISLMASEEYQEVSNTLFGRISEKPNLVFIYEALLSGETKKEVWSPYYRDPTEQELNRVLSLLESLDLELMPYRKNAQVTVLAESFLLDTETNLFLRVYVPSGRMWSNETDRLLQLFGEYLSNIRHLSIRLDQQRTHNGIIYEFHGDAPKGENGLSVEFSEFTHFLDICVSDQTAAEAMLVAKRIRKEEVSEILSRYSKEAKRLFIDIKHERERKILTIQQRLESELIDVLPGDIDLTSIKKIVESTVPSSISSVPPLGITQPSESSLVSYNQSGIIMNVSSQIIETVKIVVDEEINGSQNLGVQGQQLLELVHKYGEAKAGELAFAVYEMEDKDVRESDRLKALQKLKNFLSKLRRIGANIAVAVLESYISKYLGL